MAELSRKSNFELLRILAMFLIILIHFVSEINLSDLGLSGEGGRILGASVVGICNMGTTCFILISGYFGMKFSLKKLLKFEIMMIIYAFLETFALWLAFPEEMQGVALLEEVVKSCLPFASRKHWFYSCYICVFLFSGYIQKFIDTLKKEEFEKVIALSLVIFNVLPTLFYFEIVQDAGKGLVHTMCLYILGRYIRLYRNGSSNKRKILLLFSGLWILNAISIMYPIRIGSLIHSLCRDDSVTNIVMAVILLYLFKDMNFSSKYVNKLTRNMFAVFALENSGAAILAQLVKQSNLHVSNFFLGIGLLIGSVLLIFAICLLVGMIVEFLLGKIENKIIKVLMDLISNAEQYLFKFMHRHEQ